MHSRRFPAAAMLAAALSPLAATAQIPVDTAIIGTVSFGQAAPSLSLTQPGTTGLFLAPLPTSSTFTPQPATRITGLPSSLEKTSSQFGGVWSVQPHAPTGTLVVGPFKRNNVDLHLLSLQGTTVATAQTVNLGTATPGWIIGVSVAPCPDGRMLIGTSGRTVMVPGSGPAAVSELAFLDLSGATPTLTPLPITAGAFPDFVDGVQVSADGHAAYVITQPGNGVPPYRLYRVDIDPSSASYAGVTLLHTFSTDRMLSKPELRDDGTLFVAGADLTTSQTTVHLIDTNASPVNVVSLPGATAGTSLIGPVSDPADGRSVFASWNTAGSVGGAFANGLVLGSDPFGATTPFATPPAGGWCAPFAVAVGSSFARYGNGTPAADSYRIVDTPNPGGRPAVGNGSFSITIASDGAAPSFAWLALGTQPITANVLGLDALVLPTTMVGMTPGPQPQYALPLPNNPALAGLTLFAQALLIDAGGFASSDAVRIEITP